MRKIALIIATFVALINSTFSVTASDLNTPPYRAYVFTSDGIFLHSGSGYTEQEAQTEAFRHCFRYSFDCLPAVLVPNDVNNWWRVRLLRCPSLGSVTWVALDPSGENLYFDNKIFFRFVSREELIYYCTAFDPEIGGQKVYEWLRGDELIHEPD